MICTVRKKKYERRIACEEESTKKIEYFTSTGIHNNISSSTAAVHNIHEREWVQDGRADESTTERREHRQQAAAPGSKISLQQCTEHYRTSHTLIAKYLCSGGPHSPENDELGTSTAFSTDPYKQGRTVSITCHRRPLLAETSMKPPCSVDPGRATNGLGLTRWPRFHSGAGKPVAMVVVVVVDLVLMSDQAARTELLLI